MAESLVPRVGCGCNSTPQRLSHELASSRELLSFVHLIAPRLQEVCLLPPSLAPAASVPAYTSNHTDFFRNRMLSAFYLALPDTAIVPTEYVHATEVHDVYGALRFVGYSQRCHDAHVHVSHAVCNS